MLYKGRARQVLLCKAIQNLLDAKKFVTVQLYTIEAWIIKAYTEGGGSKRDATYVPFWA